MNAVTGFADGFSALRAAGVEPSTVATIADGIRVLASRLAEAIECCTIKDNRNLHLEIEVKQLMARLAEAERQNAELRESLKFWEASVPTYEGPDESTDDSASPWCDTCQGEHEPGKFPGCPAGSAAVAPKFDKVWCSQCGCEFGPRDSGYSHCEDHRREEGHAEWCASMDPDKWRTAPSTCDCRPSETVSPEGGK
jgi:hypothetical protein